MNNSMNRLEEWYNEIKNFEKLSIADAKKLTRLMLSSSGEEREMYRQKLILGTLYLIYNFVKSSEIDMIKSCSFDMDDVINSCVFEWIKIIDSGKILEVSIYSLLFQRKFYNNLVLDLIDNSDDRVHSMRIFGFLYKNFSDILSLCLEDVKNGVLVDYDRCSYYLNKINYHGCFDSCLIEDIYLILSVIINDLDNIDDCNISKTRLNWMKKLLLCNAIIDKNVSVENIGNSVSIDDVIDNVFYRSISDIVFNTDILTEREKLVVAKRFGLSGEDCMSIKEISCLWGVSSQYIGQTMERALSKLRYYFYCNDRDLYDERHRYF